MAAEKLCTSLSTPERDLIGEILTVLCLVFILIASGTMLYMIAFEKLSFTWENLSICVLSFGACLICLVVIFLEQKLRVSIFLRRMICLAKDDRAGREIILTPERYCSNDSFVEEMISFKTFFLWKKSPDLILLYRTSGGYILFPRRWFSEEQWGTFQTYLTNAFGSFK